MLKNWIWLPLFLVGCLDAEFAPAADPMLAAGVGRTPYPLGWVPTHRDRPIRLDSNLDLALPKRVDLRSRMTPIANQESFNACPAFAITKGLREFQLKQTGRPQALSARFAWYAMRRYWESKEPQNPAATSVNTGVPVDLAMEAFAQFGTVPEDQFPFMPPTEVTALKALPVAQFEAALHQWSAVAPSPDLYAQAKPFRFEGPVQNVETLDDIRLKISQNRPVVLGFFVYDSFFSSQATQTGRVPVPNPAKERYVGGHIMLVAGYDDERRHLIIRNSYGPTWGDKGYGYIPYGYFQVKFEDGYPAVRGGYTVS